MMFAAPPDQSLEWSDAGIEGAHRFLRRLWKLCAEHVNAGTINAYKTGDLTAELKGLRLQLHSAINKITDDYARRQTFNTAIAAVMELLNSMAKINTDSEAARSVMQECLEYISILLAPIVPHMCGAMWSELRPGTDLATQNWPQADESALIQDEVTMMIQVNGKLRGEMTISKTADKATIEQIALTHELVLKFTAGATPKKIVVVPNRLINIVI
jgi:leucyl-tRNA synthetase